MIKDPISKMYKHMNSKELALLAFANLTIDDPLELARITEAVPLRTYQALDYAFREHLSNVFDVACCWSIQYWQCKTRQMTANAVLLAHLHDNTKIEQLVLDDEIVERYAKQIAALEIALEEVCLEYHIDINAVKQIAGITTSTKRKNIPDADYLRHIKGEMCAVLDGVKKG